MSKFAEPMPLASNEALEFGLVRAKEMEFISGAATRTSLAGQHEEVGHVGRPTKSVPAESPALEAAIEASDVKTVVETKKTAPKTENKAPWADITPDTAPKHSNFKMSAETHAKLTWITDNVPKMKSFQKIIDHFLLDGIEDLIKKHYNP